MLNGFHFFHVRMYIYIYVIFFAQTTICNDSISIHIETCFFQINTFTLPGYVVNGFGLVQGWIPDYIHCPDCSQNRFFHVFAQVKCNFKTKFQYDFLRTFL